MVSGRRRLAGVVTREKKVTTRNQKENRGQKRKANSAVENL